MRKKRFVKEVLTDKPRRGRPRKTETNKAADPRRILIGEIKTDLKRVKKSKKRLTLLLEKAQAEQSILMAALLDSLVKIKIELKKKPKKAKKAKTGRRGRPGRKPGRKSSKKLGRKPGKPNAKKETKTPITSRKKRGRPRKAAKAKQAEAKKVEVEKKPQITQGDKLVTPIPKPGMKVFKRAVSKPSPKKKTYKTKEAPVPEIFPNEELKTE